MTELLLICAFCVLGVALSATVARWLVMQPLGDQDLVRVADMVAGGASRYLRRQTAVSVAVAGVVGAGVFLVYGIAYQLDAVTLAAPRELGASTLVSYALGVAFGVVAARVAAWAAHHASARVASGARRSLDEPLQIAVRAGAVSGVVALALGLVGFALLFLGVFLYTQSVGGSADALARAARIPMMLPGFALGAAFVALLVELGGGIFGKVADLGADVVGKLEGSLPDDAASNPATLADLVGDSVGSGASRTVGVFAVGATESLAAMLVAAMVYRSNPSLPSVTALVLYPLVARTFGLLASLFGVMVVRTDDTESPMSALMRGFYVTIALCAVGVVGTAKWLLGAHWPWFGGAALLGLAASVALLHLVHYCSDPRHGPVRAAAEAARAGPTMAVLRGMSAAAEGTTACIVLVSSTALCAYQLGTSTGLTGGGLLGVALFVGGLIGGAPYVLAMNALGSIADTAGGIIEMTVARERPDVGARARLLDAVGTTAKSYTSILVTLASSLACLLLLATFLGEVREQARMRAAGADGVAAADLADPTLLSAALLGLLVVLTFGWTTLRRIVTAGRDLVNELHTETDQLACVEMVSRMSLRGMLAPVIAGVGLPICIGAVLRLWAREDRVGAPAEALVALLFAVTVAGAVGSLLFSNAGSVWDNAKKYIETGAHGGRYVVGSAIGQTRAPTTASPGAVVEERPNPTYVAAVIADTIGDPLKGALGPAMQALAKTLAALALVFLPFFL